MQLIGRGLCTSFNNDNSANFSGEKKYSEKFQGVYYFFDSTWKNLKSNLVLVLESKGLYSFTWLVVNFDNYFEFKEKFTPVKYFSIDRVFRNETLDATHLAEFHQIEGVVADYNLTLGDLIGILYEFFKKLGECITLLQ